VAWLLAFPSGSTILPTGTAIPSTRSGLGTELRIEAELCERVSSAFTRRLKKLNADLIKKPKQPPRPRNRLFEIEFIRSIFVLAWIAASSR
jgi:hypothetical protein